MDDHDLLIIASARKRGYSDDDIRHVVANAIRVVHQDDDMVMHVGATSSGHVLEVGVITSAEGIRIAAHAMKCRQKYLPTKN